MTFDEWLQTKEADKIRDTLDWENGVEKLMESIFEAIRLAWLAGQKAS